MTNPLTSHLDITICTDAADAVAQGFDWAKDPTVKPIEVKQVVVVRNGTEAGNGTADFVLEDENGQRYVFMITGRLLKSIPC